MITTKRFLTLAACLFVGTLPALSETETTTESIESARQKQPVLVKPYRTFVTVKKYILENNGIPSKPISNVRLEIKFPGGTRAQLPEGGHYWSIGNNQSQEINRTFELPFALIQNDGFNFELTMVRSGKKILPCRFEVAQLSQFNRSYVCRTDVAFQQNQQIPQDKIAKEAVEIRVFSDLNSPQAELPKDAIALK